MVSVKSIVRGVVVLGAPKLLADTREAFNLSREIMKSKSYPMGKSIQLLWNSGSVSFKWIDVFE